MHRRTLLLAALTVPVPTFAQEAGGLPVVASFSILADMVGRIGGDAVRVTTLVPRDGDAHTYQPRPADLRTLQGARLLVENGLGLEGWIGRMVSSSGFRGVRVTASARVKPRTMQEGKSRVTDPHTWQDPGNGVLYAQTIADGLVRAVPAQSDAIRARAASYIAEINATDAWIMQTLAPIPPARRRIITSHDAFGYFAARYGITMRGVQGIDTEAEPSAKDISTLVAQIRREGIKAVFVENMTDPRLAAMLAREAGAVLGGTVYSDALSAPDGPAPTYLAMFRHNVTAFARAMQANP